MPNTPDRPDLTGRPGMAARVDRVRGLAPGRLVVLREPAGLLTTLVDSATPVFSWLCQVLGAPARIDGKDRRELYIADRCLTPVSSMNSDQIGELIRDQGREDFAAALEDLKTILARSSMTGEDLDEKIGLAGEQLAIQRSLEVVATATALHEAGFRVVNPDGELMRWVAEHDGVALRFEASHDPFGAWMVSSNGRSAREVFCDQTTLPPEGPRGQLLHQVLELWRSAFRLAPAPRGLAPGETYARHRLAVKQAALLPTLQVDPAAFRSVRQLLKRRYAGADELPAMRISHADGLLRIEVDGRPYGCPANGLWADGCEIALSELLGLEAGVLRRRGMTLELAPGHLLINGCPIATRQPPREARP